ncbi:membrane protein DedA, SNARE-associated domain [Arthrobacter alpinus]|uniref:Membrane protein DedA, SNARE-associated domain n=1 Tax=Arthrobacter alpinus TaxID=656366 RepID=A0A1H5ISZ3_9MICC|nr:DedA family protein [Arthrobacter alpinus]SEE43187.1 membrane protein DedA, SNARE-associated domain [Arthrobacter alpinus]
MTALLLEAAGQPWIYAAVVLGCLIDGFFPPIPSEALVVGMASLAAAHGGHGLWLLLLAALLGAFLGDNAAYILGRRLGTSRFKWMRRPLMQRSFAKAGQGLESRAVSMILVARFLPGARVAVNLTAGATGFQRRKFIAISAFSAFLWASYSVLIGALAGVWLREHPILGFVAAIILAASLGLALDLVITKFRARSRNGSTKRGVGPLDPATAIDEGAQHPSTRESVVAAGS